jgi:ribonuclease R
LIIGIVQIVNFIKDFCRIIFQLKSVAFTGRLVFVWNADLIVHRKLFSSLSEKQVHTKDQLEHTCNHISKMEKQAVDAERASIKYMQVMYLKEKIGEQFKGMISGLTDWGIYVELEENKCEGMIPLNSMKDDQYYYDSEKKITSGYGSKKTYKMGQEIKVMVKKADLHKRQIDFKIIN